MRCYDIRDVQGLRRHEEWVEAVVDISLRMQAERREIALAQAAEHTEQVDAAREGPCNIAGVSLQLNTCEASFAVPCMHVARCMMLAACRLDLRTESIDSYLPAKLLQFVPGGVGVHAETFVDTLDVESLITRLKRTALASKSRHEQLPAADSLWTDESDGAGSDCTASGRVSISAHAATATREDEQLVLQQQRRTEQFHKQLADSNSASDSPPSPPAKQRSVKGRLPRGADGLNAVKAADENRPRHAPGRGIPRSQRGRGLLRSKASSVQETSSDNDDTCEDDSTIQAWRAERRAMKAL